MTQENPANTPAAANGVDEIEQVREILFGIIMRDYEERFAQLEQIMEKRLHMLEDDFVIRANGLEQRIKNYTDRMTKQLSQEKEELQKWQSELNNTLKRLNQHLNSSKIDRQQLASLLTALAAQIEQAPESENTDNER